MKKYFEAIDLFSGCGGLTLGLKQAGFRVVGAVEIDTVAAETYAANHPEVTLWVRDIRKLTGAQVRRTLKLRKGQLDLLAGCPPCQGFSAMRTRNGNRRIRDRRNDLIFDYLRMVKALRPKAVMMENVPALARNSRMTKLMKKLEVLGYEMNGTPIILNTAEYAVPQRRKRMILVCSRVGKIDLPSGTKTRKTVRQAIGSMVRPSQSRDPLHALREDRDPENSEHDKVDPEGWRKPNRFAEEVPATLP